MGKSAPGDPGQAGTYDPKGGGKFEPTTKAQPPDPDPEHPHRDHPHKGKHQPHATPPKPDRPHRPRPK